MGVRNSALSFLELLSAVYYKLKVLSPLLNLFVLQTIRPDFECPCQ